MWKKIKLLLINQSFYPDEDATGQIMTDLAEDLAKRNIEVTVVTGRRTGSRYEVHNRVQIFRVPVLKLNKNFLLFRYLNYLSFFPSVFIRVLLMPRSDCLFVVSSPPFMYFIGWVLKYLKRTKLIFNVQDLYPDVAVKLKLLRNRILINLIQNLTLMMYRSADKIICIGEVMEKLLIRRGVPANKVVVIHNFADGKAIFPIIKQANKFLQQNGWQNEFLVQYSGNFGMVHEMDTILQAAKKLSHYNDIKFLLIGDGVQAGQIKKFINEQNLENVILLPYQPRSKLNFSLNAADVSLVTLKEGFAGAVVPSKLYGIMAAGKPVLAICPKDSEVSQIVSKYSCGIQICPGDVQGCINAILYLYHDRCARARIGESSRKEFLLRYEREIQTKKYYDIIIRQFS